VFAYVTGRPADGDTLPLMRLRHGGSAARWGFAIYLASKDGYEDSILPTGDPASTPEDALDTACSLYLAGPPPGPETPDELTSGSTKTVMPGSTEGIHRLSWRRAQTVTKDGTAR